MDFKNLRFPRVTDYGVTLLLLAMTLTLESLPAARPCSAAEGDRSEPQTIRVHRAGEERPTQAGPEANFTGAVRVAALFAAAEPSRLGAGSVTFAPGARSAWHTHPAGQTLIVTDGVGRIGMWDGPVQEFRTGDVVRIPPGVKHWHGAAPTSEMTHIALQEAVDGKVVTWMENVTDEQYDGKRATAPTQGGNTVTKNHPTAGLKARLGDFAPKMVQLTDEVLFQDIWERTELSKRDRSLVTIAALTAGGNVEQLTSHLNLARGNGLTEAEVIEALTHLAFYTGWPRALSAIERAKAAYRETPAPPAQDGAK